jgi:hypothetical protein
MMDISPTAHRLIKEKTKGLRHLKTVCCEKYDDVREVPGMKVLNTTQK